MKALNPDNPIRNTLTGTTARLAVTLAALALAGLPAHAAPTVWNVNIYTQITTGDNFVGAAFENTANSTWNRVTSAPQTGMALADSSGSTTAGVTLDLTGSVKSQGITSGPKIFSGFLKGNDPVNSTITINGLSPSDTYDVVVYSDWYWGGSQAYPVSQTAGTGLTGTIWVNHLTSSGGNVPALTEDTNPANSGANLGNWYRIKGLTPDASGHLGFQLAAASAVNAPFNGFQLVKIDLADATPPSPNPMTWASVPAAAGQTSITMTATTASDPGGVEYSFTETTGNPGATSSGWQDSPVYTDTGLTSGTPYTYTVSARDKSIAQNPTAASAEASATTLAADTTAPTPDPLSFATLPSASSISSITMTATTASDLNGVEYYFTETSHNLGGSDSDWQDSPVYTDGGLPPGTTYTYTVKARDKSIAQNATAASDPASATTTAETIVSKVWNVNIGNQVTTSDNYVGAALENTQNSTWNSVVNPLPKVAMTLVDATGVSTAGVTLDLSAVQGVTPVTTIGGYRLTSGDEIFYNCVGGFGTTSTMTIKGLSMSKTYDVVIYSDWYWKDGDSGYPVTQTLGTGLAGTIYVNRLLGGTDGIVLPLTEDTNPANVSAGAGNVGNWYRIKGLTPDANGQLGFRLGDGANGPLNGFQLVDTTIDLGDITAPTPNPMTWASAPAATSESSITMTATTASDFSAVEYHFTCTAGGGHDSGWQLSPVYTDTGLTPGTTYSYTVTARDKSPAQNATNPSAAASVSTLDADTTVPTPDPMTFATPPAAVSISKITMTATTASDPYGVQYSFTETSGNPGGTSSGWQDSPTYTDTGLTPSTTYTYTVKARDKSLAHNETAASTPASATTDAPVTGTKVWNVNIGNNIDQSDNFIGAAPENTLNSAWNSVMTNVTAMTLADSTGSGSAGVTLDLTSGNYGGYAPLTSGPKIFSQWCASSTPTTMVIGNLIPGSSYDLIIYSDWYWKDGDSGYPVTQTAGTGLTGTIYVNRALSGTDGVVPGLAEDTNSANVVGDTNWYRIKGLTPDASGNLAFTMGGVNGPLSGFQLVKNDTATTPYDTWAKGTFANPFTAKLPTEDPDGDGQTNQQEFAFGLDPTTGASVNPITQQLAGGVFKYTRTKDSGLIYKVYYSTNLSSWTWDEFATQSPATAVAGVETVTVTLAAAAPLDGKLFVRVEASPAP